ncbi:MAG: DCC1-like thiol-disulfide oxidoreductase family protein [Candidatus Obscuribacterales bacterium]|nr:DCC1-like thiol-disulfide oxidoreductase family protein [Candidatus Obscuribacterales bacterium]
MIKKLINGWTSYQNGWTGGQYSLFRYIFGAYLFIHFLQLVPYGAELWSNQGALADGSASPLLGIFPNMFALCDTPGFVTGVLVAATGLSLMLALGWRDRLAAVLLWYIWACLFGRDPFISNPGLPYVGLMLVVHAILPSRPWGSLGKRPANDPGHAWRMPQSLFLVVWILMALGYTYSGWAKLASPSWVSGDAMERVLLNPLARTNFLRDWALMLPEPLLNGWTWYALGLELAFAPLALFRRTRPLVWFAGLSMHLGIITLVNFADLSLGMVMLHLFTFDPNWIKGRRVGSADFTTFPLQPDRVFYDGSCGLCHDAIKFLLSEDSDAKFKYAPLESDSFGEFVKNSPIHRNTKLPDSVVVLTGDGELLVKSTAALYLMSRLGGAWRILAWSGYAVPRVVRDAVYDVVASQRKKLFATAETACPLLPVELRKRFEY